MERNQNTNSNQNKNNQNKLSGLDAYRNSLNRNTKGTTANSNSNSNNRSTTGSTNNSNNNRSTIGTTNNSNNRSTIGTTNNSNNRSTIGTSNNSNNRSTVGTSNNSNNRSTVGTSNSSNNRTTTGTTNNTRTTTASTNSKSDGTAKESRFKMDRMTPKYGGKRERRTENQGAYVESDTGDEYYTAADIATSVGTSIGYALIYVIMVLGVSVIFACVGWIVANDVLALNKIPLEAVIEVTEWDDFDAVADKLKDEGLIEYRFVFDLFATITGSKEEISPGTYTVDTNMDYNALIRNLGVRSSTRAEVTITIPEGYTVDQIFELLEENGVAKVADLKEKAADYPYKFDFLQEIPLGDYHRLEGYLFPDTYTFYVYHDPLYVINTMLANFYYRVIANDVMMDRLDACGYSLQEILNVAAMIERETDGTDRRNIASVIFNRLENPSFETNGCLQIDATLYYLTGREVTQNDRETINNPYNTHINAGLPPGPICNPGLTSIQAALDPENTRYYYYALGDDGLHHFYQTYSGLSSFIKTQNRYN